MEFIDKRIEGLNCYKDFPVEDILLLFRINIYLRFGPVAPFFYFVCYFNSVV
jgi:hypothetical protein